MKVLHLIRTLDDQRALATSQAQAAAGHQVTLVLLHDAVLSDLAFPGPVYAVADDVAARGGQLRQPSSASGGSGWRQTVDYEAVVRLIEAHHRVISW